MFQTDNICNPNEIIPIDVYCYFIFHFLNTINEVNCSVVHFDYFLKTAWSNADWYKMMLRYMVHSFITILEISVFYADTWKDLSNFADTDLVQDYILAATWENCALRNDHDAFINCVE